MASAAAIALTPADLVTMPVSASGGHYELNDGELILVGNAGARHERVKNRILAAFMRYQFQYGNGVVFSESMFTLSPNSARIPDVAFVSNSKMAQLPDDDSPIPFAPDLAVEVISISESPAEVEAKVWQYLDAGVAEVWQVYPADRYVRVRSLAGNRVLEVGATLATPILAGFSVQVQDFFTR